MSYRQMSQALKQDKTRVLACDGKKYYFRRKLGNPAICDRVNRHIARGFLTHRVTLDDVEIYDIAENAPMRVKDPKPSEIAFNEFLNEIIELLCREKWRDYYLAVCELAWYVKNAGIPLQSFHDLIQHCINMAITITGKSFLGERAVLEIRRQQAEQSMIIMPQVYARH